ncbi:hypothetical protein Pmani_008534 [Petrolisthes manimaculis]|uniref:Uncharacterized protein n=1 Tax=Petrolisthes manimaculis TaxID=1843537 RepID=A0AAE1UHN6_9EUCA|nr:hypothetical protein Pmani_008534 [Petrolisthes manimaculis]
MDAEDEEDPYSDDDVDAVATPLRPAYPPASQSNSYTPPTAGPGPSCVHHQTLHVTTSLAHDLFPTQVTEPHYTNHAGYPWSVPHPSTSPLPFQPVLGAPCPHMGYYPVGVALSRVAQVLEATQPPYLLLPHHPNVPPVPPPQPPPYSRLPTAPPNTAHTHRGQNRQQPSQYPCGKSTSCSSLVSTSVTK